jgi:hypothetical protein
VIEGSPASVTATFARIRADNRHRGLRLLFDWILPFREFGDWTMVHRRASDPTNQYDAKMRGLLSCTSGPVKQCFLDLIAQEPEPLDLLVVSQVQADLLMPRVT